MAIARLSFFTLFVIEIFVYIHLNLILWNICIVLVMLKLEKIHDNVTNINIRGLFAQYCLLMTLDAYAILRL